MTVMQATEQTWRQMVGVHVAARREHLGLSKRAAALKAGISEIVWRQIESGLRQIAPGQYVEAAPSRKSRIGVCRALNWTDNSIDLLLQGMPAEPLDVTQPDDVEQLRERVERLAVQVERLSRTSIAMSAAIDSLTAQAARAAGR